MKVKHLKIFVLLALMSVMSVAFAQEKKGVITDHIQDLTQGNVKVVQPEELRNRLTPKEEMQTDSVESKASVGYRVQVFSDNNQRTARSQAQTRKNRIVETFPHLKVYVSYKSPSWRVRVGDFKTRSEAEQVMYEIKEKMPAYASEVAIVLDEINIEEK